MWNAAWRHHETVHGPVGFEQLFRRQAQFHGLVAVGGNNLEFYGITPGGGKDNAPTDTCTFGTEPPRISVDH